MGLFDAFKNFVGYETQEEQFERVKQEYLEHVREKKMKAREEIEEAAIAALQKRLERPLVSSPRSSRKPLRKSSRGSPSGSKTKTDASEHKPVKDMSAIAPRVPACVLHSKLPPKNRQAEIARYLIDHRAVIAAHGVGTGKTLLAVLAAACALRNVDAVRKVVIITPKSLVANFRDALNAYAPRQRDRFQIFTIDEFTLCYKKLLVDTWGEVRFDNSEFLHAMRQDFQDAMLVVDEAHQLRTHIVVAPGNKPQGIKAHVVLTAARFAQRVLLLTATPVVNTPFDIVNLMAMARGDETPLTHSEFERVQSVPQLLSMYASGIMSFQDSDTTSGDYPKIIRKDVQIIMHEHQQKMYERMELSQLREDETHLNVGVDPLIFYSGIRQAANQPDLLKAQYIVKILQQQENDEKRRAIVLTSFIKHGIHHVIKAFDTADPPIKWSMITGEMTAAQRSEAKAEFDDNKSQVMLLSMGAGGVGLSFNKVRHLFMYEPVWNKPTQVQAEGRANRFRSHIELPPEDRTLTIYNLRVSKRPQGRIHENAMDISADDVLIQLAETKDILSNEFLNELRKLDIHPEFEALEDGTAEEKDADPTDRIVCGPGIKKLPRHMIHQTNTQKRRSGIKRAPRSPDTFASSYVSRRQSTH